MPRAEHGETVLVVDDESSVRMLVGEVLADLGYTAIEAAVSGGHLEPGMAVLTKPSPLDDLAGRIREMIAGA